LNWTENHHVIVLHRVAGEAPVDESAITGSGEGAGIEDVGFVSFCEAEEAYVKLEVVVVCTLKVDGRILIMVDDDILVREFQVQLPDHSCRERLLCGMLVINELVDTLDDIFDELRANLCDCYGALVIVRCIESSSVSYL
jgi:hypothetical protein